MKLYAAKNMHNANSHYGYVSLGPTITCLSQTYVDIGGMVNKKATEDFYFLQQLAKYNISIERLIQIPDHKRKRASIVIITHKSKELFLSKCLKSFKSNKNVLKFPTLIRLF